MLKKVKFKKNQFKFFKMEVPQPPFLFEYIYKYELQRIIK